jgi:hypothetical protein
MEGGGGRRRRRTPDGRRMTKCPEATNRLKGRRKRRQVDTGHNDDWVISIWIVVIGISGIQLAFTEIGKRKRNEICKWMK